MGIYDSSLTRVQPAFDQLAERTEPWVRDLCLLGSRSGGVNLPVNGAGWRWEPPPSYEHSCLSPLDYLEYLVLHASDRTLLAHERISRFEGEVRAKREALFAGDVAAVQEGLAKLRAPGGTRSGKGTWQVLEGTTKIDCALFADDVTVFIEGKRTERHLTDSTQWHRQRNQVIRNLDCLRVEPFRAENWFVLLIVEAATTAEAEAQKLDEDLTCFRESLPHLTTEEVDHVRGHYIGFTTWQALQDRFNLNPYPNMIGDRSPKADNSPPTAEELRLLAKDVSYEINMFLYLNRVAIPRSSGPQLNDLRESALIHTRCLMEFFNSKPRRDDVVANHYVADWDPVEDGGSELEWLNANLETLINKRLAHLTAYRLRTPSAHHPRPSTTFISPSTERSRTPRQTR